jgi:hypothetical protein
MRVASYSQEVRNEKETNQDDSRGIDDAGPEKESRCRLRGGGSSEILEQEPRRKLSARWLGGKNVLKADPNAPEKR